MTKARPRSKKGTKKYRIELTSLSLFLWSGALFFLLTWIFVLGILVGRGFLPGALTAISDLKVQMNNLQDLVSRNRSGSSRSPKKSDSEPKLVFYEKLSSKKDEAKKKQLQESHVRSRYEIKRRKRPEIPKRDQGPLIPVSYYTVQLASLNDREKAEEMINELIHRGYAAYFYEVKLKDRTYYRIRCGKFTSRVEAKNHADKLAREEGMKGFVSRFE